ncbi:glycosyl hydrolase family 5 protein/cellulase [Peziza echinospora]|nr:glycosyl hydrolase family 5 protein/cellulase [Peziza echinospora]
MTFPACITRLWVWVALALPLVNAAVLHTSGRWILDSSNKRVKFRCVNWAGHMQTNIPEGLNHQSIDTIAKWVASAGFNCVRLTYSIDMALNPGQSVQSSFQAAASSTGISSSSLTSLYNGVIAKNPSLSSASTRQTFGKVIEELGKQGIMVVLDNHVSKASWCCEGDDGNGWWKSASGYNDANSRYFDTNQWLQGLREMANFAKSYSNVVGMSLRNELRASGSQDKNGHADWYNYVGQGAKAIHDNNKDLLIVIGGVSYAVDLGFLYDKPLDRSQFPDKVVWEFHNYAWSFPADDKRTCAQYQTLMGNGAGYLIATGKAYTGPLWLSEFGYAQVGTSSKELAYIDCISKYLESNDADWAYWALQGTYYIRDGTVDKDEGFGLLNKDWSGWRNSAFIGKMGKNWQINQGP